MTEQTAVADTGAGSSSIRRDALSRDVQKLIKPLDEEVQVRDANKRQLRLCGQIQLMVTIDSRDQLVTFYEADHLATPVILGCDFLDKNVEAIRPRNRTIELADGTIVPIIRVPKRLESAMLVQTADVQVKAKKQAGSSKVFAHEAIELPAQSQTWVSVTSKKSGLIQIEPHNRLYQTHLCLAATGINEVQPNKPFHILVANFSEEPVSLAKGQCIAKVVGSPKRLRESKVSHGEMLGIFSEEEVLSLHEGNSPNRYQKRGDLKVSDDVKFDKNLADTKEPA